MTWTSPWAGKRRARRLPRVFCRKKSSKQDEWLVGGLEHEWIMTFHSVGNVIIPTDELIFFRGVGIPPTSWGWLFSPFESMGIWGMVIVHYYSSHTPLTTSHYSWLSHEIFLLNIPWNHHFPCLTIPWNLHVLLKTYEHTIKSFQCVCFNLSFSRVKYLIQ
jgi:hypothetical protein